MGCTQSTERKQAAPAAAPAPQPVATAAPIAVVAPVEAAPVQAPEPTATVADEQPAPIDASADQATTIEPAAAPVEETPAQPTEEVQAVKEQEVVVVIAAPAEEAEAPIVAPIVVAALPPASPVADQENSPAVFRATTSTATAVEPKQILSPLKSIPALALGASSINNRRANAGKATPRTAAKVTPRNQTPSKAVAKSPAGKSPSKQVPVAAEKKVAFASNTAVPTAATAAEKQKSRNRKTAGKHFCNIQEELFLASVAAFERQLTHRGALEKHLNTR